MDTEDLKNIVKDKRTHLGQKVFSLIEKGHFEMIEKLMQRKTMLIDNFA